MDAISEGDEVSFISQVVGGDVKVLGKNVAALLVTQLPLHGFEAVKGHHNSGIVKMVEWQWGGGMIWLEI